MKLNKKFTLTVTEDGQMFNIASEVEGFNTLEIIGILESKLHDIYKQLERPAEFTRKRINEDGSVEIIEEAEHD